MKVKMNKHAWSKESKNSYSYDSETDYYEDESYRCYKCGKSSIFTAREQKEVYEHQKCYIWQKRTLCPECYKNYNSLKKQLNIYQEQWSNETEASKKKAPYLKEWLKAINDMPNYGKPKNESMAKMLFKIINEIA